MADVHRAFPEAIFPDPQQLYKGDPDKVQSYVFEKMIWVVGPTIGSGLQFCHNYCLDRPYHAGNLIKTRCY